MLLIELGEFEPTEDLSVVLAESFEGVLEEIISAKLSGLVSDVNFSESNWLTLKEALWIIKLESNVKFDKF